MGPVPIPKPRRVTAGGLLALALCIGLAPARAVAGCDHDAAVGGGFGPGHFELLAKAGALPRSPRSPGGKAPCSGPTCSDAPHAPPAPTTMVPGTPADWGCLAAIVTIPAPPPAELPTSPATSHPQHVGATVFHPPRCGAGL